MKIESIGQLDKALNFLYAKSKVYYTHDELKEECFDNDSSIDVEAIINKLNNDNCLHYGIYDSNKVQFKISIDGKILKERGGYQAKFRREWFQRNPFIEKLILVFIGFILGQLPSLFHKQKANQSHIQVQLQEHPAKTNLNELKPNLEKQTKDSALHN